jgi:Tripartite tricarboxylate transporter family receptor
VRKWIVTSIGLALLLSGTAQGQTSKDVYPNRPVRMIVPFGAGGPGDIFARLIGQKLSEQLGQQFVIENRPGAGGNIGAGVAARAPADGYTLLIGSSTLWVNATRGKMTKALRRSDGTFAPGWRGGGRPPGQRNKFSEVFLEALTADFVEHGPAVIAKVRAEKPVDYLRSCTSLIPRQVSIERLSPFSDISDEELQLLDEYLTALRARTVSQLNGEKQQQVFPPASPDAADCK